MNKSDGNTTGPVGLSASIEQQLQHSHTMPIVQFERVETELPALTKNDLSTDRQCQLNILRTVLSGKSQMTYSERIPGKWHIRDGLQQRLEFDGKGCFETFLYQFENCAKYNHWNSDDKVAHLRWSLTGIAAQLLWETEDLRYKQLIDKLRATERASVSLLDEHDCLVSDSSRPSRDSTRDVYVFSAYPPSCLFRNFFNV
jgi:hypothetical protein